MSEMILTEIDHVAIAVRDLEAAIDFYRRAFGAEVHHREIVESDGVEEALVKVADSYITAATRPDVDPVDRRGEGLHHIGYWVDDRMSARQDGRRRCHPIDKERDRFPGTTVAFVHPPRFGTS